MGKQYGSDLKKKYLRLTTDLNNTKSKIEKRFDLVVDSFSKYMSDEHMEYLRATSISDLDIDRKLEIIIQTEANYAKITSNQMEFF